MRKFNLEKIQQNLSTMNTDGWLLYDFRGSNDLALDILDVSKEKHLTRRFYYFIPKSGTPVKIVNAIEAGNLDHLPGEKLTYASHSSLSGHLSNMLKGVKTVAMEYSPNNNIPYVSKVDAGTIEQIRALGVDIVSSGDLISLFGAVWTKEQYEENIPVAEALNDIVDEAFKYIKANHLEGITLNEFEVQTFIMKEFEKRGYYTDHPPIVGVNGNAANPHYAPDKDNHAEIKTGDFLLIDLWAKLNKESGVWADITWVGYMGDEVPERFVKVFNVVAEARDTALELVTSRFAEGKEVRGYEVDSAARNVIEKAGYGEYFIHRTGHSITTTLHGSGAHMDNYETKDERLLLPSTSFSIEPGIYIPGDFGVRLEIDVYISPDGKVKATGKKIQREIIPILK